MRQQLTSNAIPDMKVYLHCLPRSVSIFFCSLKQTIGIIRLHFPNNHCCLIYLPDS